ncbi:hypothetical protein PN497_20730 [Sphaerospermopsis kisseleviana CS-549]|uniref:Uncharacterized protein n=2 Tax=Sphaerospermopsis TaxID=752201 RepID=A0ABR9VK60_9CYAN|nr:MULTISPECIES: hypothetical protein [Sphaerospermopsis]MBE9238037.1 hypothetical protein [Sphaerospermopsis aphanizomenoides LEGE 00250]MDB9443756.1 hypothetical protein [Sphaerospermopsis kisseleviana CS-549]
MRSLFCGFGSAIAFRGCVGVRSLFGGVGVRSLFGGVWGVIAVLGFGESDRCWECGGVIACWGFGGCDLV